MSHNFARRTLLVLAAAALLPLATGCGRTTSDEQVVVEEESSALAAAFDRIRDSRSETRLGDLINEAGIPVGDWDRMYSFQSATSKSINDRLHTDGLRWRGLPMTSDSLVQVFVREGKVVYAYHDHNPRYAVGKYATPESRVAAVERKIGDKPKGETYWSVRIEEFPK